MKVGKKNSRQKKDKMSKKKDRKKDGKFHTSESKMGKFNHTVAPTKCIAIASFVVV